MHVVRETERTSTSESARKSMERDECRVRNGRRATQTFGAHASLIVGVGNVLTREPERTPRRGPNATTARVIVDIVPILRVRPVLAKSGSFVLTKSGLCRCQLSIRIHDLEITARTINITNRNGLEINL